jgi:hypothetical protein
MRTTTPAAIATHATAGMPRARVEAAAAPSLTGRSESAVSRLYPLRRSPSGAGWGW